MIPDEALEAAHKAWREQATLDGSIFEYNLRAALEAAAPHLMALALREAAADTHARGDIGKEDGIEAWTYLEWRARKVDATDV